MSRKLAARRHRHGLDSAIGAPSRIMRMRRLVRGADGSRSVPARVMAALVSLVGIIVTMVAATGMAAASANSANPAGAVTGSSVTNADGSVTVSLNGAWSWAPDGSPSPQASCSQRYGVGFVVSWWGMSSSAALPTFPVTTSQWIGTPPTAASVGPVTAAGYLPSAAGNFFVPKYYVGQITDLCSDTQNGYPVGTWSAQATYGSAADVPPKMCVNFYDEHGKAGSPSKSASDYSATGDSDNSIQKNAFNPAIGGNCFVTPAVQKPTITVVKVNNADGTGTWSQSETATGPGEDVPFRATISNSSTSAVVVDTLTDQWPNTAAFSPTCTPAVVGQTIPAGGSITCNFTETGYAPAAGQSLTDTVDVSVHQSGNPNNSTSATASSTVTTPGASTLSISVLKQNNADGTGNWSQSETAPAAGQDVPFRATVTNHSATAVVVDSLTDAWPGTPAFSPTCNPVVVGQTLAANGGSIVCNFTEPSYSPPAGQSLTDTVDVTVHDTANPANSVSASSNSTVTTQAVQAISGAILLCDTNGAPTTSPVSGGTITVSSGSSVVTSAADQLSATQVPAGSYTMAAAAPSQYQFVTCGQSGVTITSPASASQSLTVPAGGSGRGVFYVQPVTPPPAASQTVDGSILLCGTDGTPTTQTVDGGSLSVLNGSTVVATAANQMASTAVPAGTYSMDASAPASYMFVTCGTSGTTVSSPTAASQTVVVPAGGAGHGSFFVAPVPLSITVVKTTNADGTGNWSNSETESTLGENVPFRATITNTSPVPVVVNAVRDAWPGQDPFDVTCAQQVIGVTLQPQGSITCDFTADSYPVPTAGSLTDTVTAVVGELNVPANSTVGNATATVSAPPQVLGETLTAPTPGAPTLAAPTTPTAVAGQLPFTGAPTHLKLMLLLGLSLGAAGFLALWLSGQGRREDTVQA
jgi:hypothetical protein